MTNIKPTHIVRPDFNLINGPGIAEEDVLNYLSELVPSYNRLMDAEFTAREIKDRLIEENETLNAEKTALENEKETLQNELNIASETNESLVSELQTKSVDYDALATLHDAKENEIVELNSKIASLNERIDSLNSQTWNENSTPVVVDTKVSELEETIQKLSTENEELKTNLEQARKEAENNVTPDVTENAVTVSEEHEERGFDTYEKVIYDTSLEPTERAHALLTKAYKLGEDYIETSQREGDTIVEKAHHTAELIKTEADTYSEETRFGANDYAEKVQNEANLYSEETRANAEDAAENIIGSANHEAEHVKRSVNELREESENIVTRLRDFFYGNIERVEQIVAIEPYDPETFRLREEPVNEVVTPEPVAVQQDDEDLLLGQVVYTPQATEETEEYTDTFTAPSVQYPGMEAEETEVFDVNSDDVPHVETSSTEEENTNNLEHSVEWYSEQDSALNTNEPVHNTNSIFTDGNAEIVSGSDETSYSKEFTVSDNNEPAPKYRSFAEVVNPNAAFHAPEATEENEANEETPETVSDEEPKKKKSFKDFLTGNKK